MAKKIVKQLPHLRIRIDPKLTARLEKARETNRKTLTGEIVDRLEESFSTRDKIVEAIRIVEKFYGEKVATLEKQNADLTERLNLAGEIQVRDAERAAVTDAQMKLFDVLVGDNPATKAAIRSLALHFAANPRWAETPNLVSQMVLHAGEIIKAAAEKDDEK